MTKLPKYHHSNNNKTILQLNNTSDIQHQAVTSPEINLLSLTNFSDIHHQAVTSLQINLMTEA